MPPSAASPVAPPDAPSPAQHATPASTAAATSPTTTSATQTSSRVNSTASDVAVSSRDVGSSRDAHSRRLLLRPFDRILAVYLVAMVTATICVLVLAKLHNPHLRPWLIVNAVLTVVRISGWIFMHSFPDRWSVLHYALIWVFRLFNVGSIACCIVGIVYVRKANRNDTDDSVRILVVSIAIVELAVLALSVLLGIIIFLFALRPVLSNRQVVQGATKEDLSKLRTFRFVPDACDSPSCSICLCDYQPDELLRELPCAVSNHFFHAACIDEWLVQKLSCPICRDDPLNSRRRTNRSTRPASPRSISPRPPSEQSTESSALPVVTAV